MTLDQLARLDLNLLVTLSLLLEECSTTKAAKRLHVSQSAMSKSLARLRDVFEDPLFVRHAKGLTPTPRAVALQKPLAEHLRQLGQLVAQPGFEPASSTRRFKLASIDGAFHSLLPDYFPSLRQAAPGLTFSFYNWNETSMHALFDGQLDLALMVRENMAVSPYSVEQLPSTIQYLSFREDPMVCLVHHRHPALEAPWDLDNFIRHRHIDMYCERDQQWMLDLRLAEQGLARDISVVVPSLDAAVSITACDEVILSVPQLYARQICQHYPLTILPMPLPLDTLSYILAWHQRFDEDPGHQWLRRHIHARLSQS